MNKAGGAWPRATEETAIGVLLHPGRIGGPVPIRDECFKGTHTVMPIPSGGPAFRPSGGCGGFPRAYQADHKEVS